MEAGGGARWRCDLRRSRETQQQNLGYPLSALTLDERPHDASNSAVLRAGDRAPDAPCRGAAGQPVRLFTLSGVGGCLRLRYEASGPSPLAARPGLRIADIGTAC
jgi:hypothetical protein